MDPVVWVHRTKTGRIVYKRKKHHFSYLDALRIIRKMRPGKTPLGIRPPAWLAWFMQLLRSLLRQYLDFIQQFTYNKLDPADREILAVLGAWKSDLEDLLVYLVEYKIDPDLGIIEPEILVAAEGDEEPEQTEA